MQQFNNKDVLQQKVLSRVRSYRGIIHIHLKSIHIKKHTVPHHRWIGPTLYFRIPVLSGYRRFIRKYFLPKAALPQQNDNLWHFDYLKLPPYGYFTIFKAPIINIAVFYCHWIKHFINPKNTILYIITHKFFFGECFLQKNPFSAYFY